METNEPTNEDRERLRERVKAILEASSRTQKQIETALGWSSGTMSRVLGGRKAIDAELLAALAGALGTDPKELVADTRYAHLLGGAKAAPAPVVTEPVTEAAVAEPQVAAPAVETPATTVATAGEPTAERPAVAQPAAAEPAARPESEVPTLVDEVPAREPAAAEPPRTGLFGRIRGLIARVRGR